MSKTDFVKITLEKVNAIRAAFGAQPINQLPKGLQHACESCPIALALRDAVPRIEVHDGYILSNNWEQADKIAAALGVEYDEIYPYQIPLPRTMKRFVNKFDDGELPEFDIRKLPPPQEE